MYVYIYLWCLLGSIAFFPKNLYPKKLVKPLETMIFRDIFIRSFWRISSKKWDPRGINRSPAVSSSNHKMHTCKPHKKQVKKQMEIYLPQDPTNPNWAVLYSWSTSIAWVRYAQLKSVTLAACLFLLRFQSSNMEHVTKINRSQLQSVK